jgi:hypothetical protein
LTFAKLRTSSGVVALQSLDIDAADAERRTAVERERQVRGIERRVDARFARDGLRGCVRTRRKRADREALGRCPRFLPPFVAFGQQPFLAQLRDRGAALGRIVGRPRDVDRDALHERRLAGRDHEVHAHRLHRSIDADVDARGEEPLRRGGLFRLRHGIAREAIEEVFRHLPVVLPADEVDGAAQRCGDVVGRDDLDAITNSVVGMTYWRSAGVSRLRGLRSRERS